MKTKRELKSMSDDDLLRRLSELLQSSRSTEVELIAHLAEVDERRLYSLYASSLFTYSTKVLHMSEHEALLRMRVARASRKYPSLLEMLADGRLHLSGIAKLAPLLTEDNYETILARAVFQSKRRIEELVAELTPKPDVPPSIRKLPNRRMKDMPKQEALVGPDQVQAPHSEHQQDKPEVDTPTATPTTTKPAKMEPLAPSRYKISFTASTVLRDKLEKLKGLMRSSVPDGNLATLIEEAVTEKIEKLESKRYGKTKNPRKNLEKADTSSSSRYIPAPVRRAVYERDQHQCTFNDATGRRCGETERLEFHHVRPYGRGGGHSPENVFLVCRTHNLYLAERDYGKELMDRYRRSPNGVSEPSALYVSSNRGIQRNHPYFVAAMREKSTEALGTNNDRGRIHIGVEAQDLVT